jgi:hypothetical protein
MRINATANLIILLFLIAGLAIPQVAAFADGGRPEAGLTGTWHTRWIIMEYGALDTYEFDMILTQSASQVSGTGNAYGWSIAGTLAGTSLTGTWSAASLPANAPHTNGQFKITVDPSGYSFSGIFKGQYHYDWDPRFTVMGQRTSAPPQPTPPNPQPPLVPPTPTPTPTPTPAPMPTPTPTPSPTPISPQPPACNFTGIWDTDFGDLQLTQTGNVLTGVYNYQEGKITGGVTGNTATGTWSESPSFQPPLDAGDFTFTLSSDCKLFTGQWRYGSCDWDGDINGKRVAPPTPTPAPTPAPTPVPTPAGQTGWGGTWDSPYGKMVITVSGNQVTGAYEHSHGRFTGTISGNTLRGVWAEEPSYRPPEESGDMELTLAADAQSFTGRWRYGSSGSWTDNWNGSRSPALKVPGAQGACDWTGTWSFDWDSNLRLTQSGTSVTGTYIRGGKTCYVNGTVSDKTFNGTFTEGSDQGKIQLVISSDCNKFTGQYTHTMEANSGWYYMHDQGVRLSQPQPQPQPNPGPLPNFYPNYNYDWTGVWNTDWGTMQFMQSGTNVSGTYTLDSGKIQGAMTGIQLSGAWSKSPSYTTPKDAGALQLNMSPLGDQFVGRWKYGACPWEGSWNGKLKGADAGPSPSPSPSPSPTPTPSPAPAPTPTPTPGNHNPSASFTITPPSPRTGDTVVAAGQCSDPDGDPLAYSWYFDGAQQAQYANKTFFVQPNVPAGTHTVSLQVSDGKGGTASFQSQISASQPAPPQPTPGTNHPPTAYFYISPQTPATSDTIVVVSQASDQDGDVLSYSWYKDGTPVTEYNNQAYMVWTNPPLGTHIISLQVSDTRGGVTPVQQQVYISQSALPPSAPQPVPPSPAPTPAPTPGANNAPKAYFAINPPQPQAGNDIRVTSQSTDPDGDRLNITWNVDGQAMSQYAGQTSWIWTRPSSGGHVVQLNADDGRGGTDTFSRRVKIPGGPTPVPDNGRKKIKIGPLSCFIATAAYGSETTRELDLLRAFRDRVLLKTGQGKWLVDTYYQMSPPLAGFIADPEHEEVRTFVREQLLDPVITLLKKTENQWNR